MVNIWWFDQLQGTSIYITCTIMWTMVNKANDKLHITNVYKWSIKQFVLSHVYIYIDI